MTGRTHVTAADIPDGPSSPDGAPPPASAPPTEACRPDVGPTARPAPAAGNLGARAGRPAPSARPAGDDRAAAAIARSLRLVARVAPAEAGLLAVLHALSGLTPALLLWLSARVIDDVARVVQGGASPDGLRALLAEPALGLAALGLLALHCLNESLEALASLTADRLRDRVRWRVQRALVEKVSGLPGLLLFERPDLRNTLALARGGVRRLAQLVGGISAVGIGLFGLLPVLLLSGRLGWWVPIVLVAGVLPVIRVKGQVVTASWQVQRSHARTLKRIESYERMLSADAFAHEVRLLNIRSHLLLAWDHLFSTMLRDLARTRLRGAWRIIAWSTLSAVGVVIPFCYLVARALEGGVSVGELALFVGVVLQLRTSLTALVFNTGDVVESALGMGPVFAVLDLEPDLPVRAPPAAAPANAAPPPSEPRGIILSAVSFAYPGSGREVLSDITLHLKPHERVALVGENGAGKTTLVKLLCRFYDPQAGAIAWDGRDISTVEPAEHRARIATVFQDFARFEATARENVGFGRLCALDDLNALRDAAGRARLDGIIDTLPGGWNTPLTKGLEGGTQLSGGQWQRVALARAFLRRTDAELILLDEPTSALDPNAEHEMLELLDQVGVGRITLIVSHRLALTRTAHRVVVLREGRIVEEGPHEELMARKGAYFAMFTRQASRYTGE